MKVGQLIANLAKKLNLDTTAEEFKEVVGISIEIDDETATKIEKGLLTIDAAKAHKDVRKVIRAEVLNGVDATLAELVEELGVEVDDDFKNETNSFTKIGKLAKRIKDIESKKAANPEQKKEIEKQIEKLNADLREAKKALADKEAEFKLTRDNDLTNFELQKILLGKNYALPKEMDSDLKVQTALNAVTRELTKKGFKIARTEDGQLTVLNKEGLEAYNEKNEAVKLSDFIDSALAVNKLLAISDPNQQQGGGNNGQHQQHHLSNGGAQPNNAILAEIDAQLQMFQ